MLGRKEIETIERYLRGEADNSEADFVRSLFADGGSNQSLIDYIQNDWSRVLAEGSNPEYDIDNVLRRIHVIIESEEKKRSELKVRKAISVYQKIAAIAFIPLLLTGLYFSSGAEKERKERREERRKEVTQIMISAPTGARVAFTLPDSSMGMLNSGSFLSYSIPFEKSRHVELEGEAWFEVAPMEKSPFEISTGISTIRVLGTRFNVSSYPGDNYMEVVLDEGRVEVTNSGQKEKIIMSPAERLVLSDGKSSISFVDPEKYNAWTEGKLVFRGDLMPEVARRIERWYNVEIIVEDDEINKYSFRGTFKDDSLEEVLRFLCLTSPISYRINHKEFNRESVTNKTQVIITKNK